VHTRVTSLPRRLRAYLRLGGQPLIEIDVCGAQPILLAVLLRNQPRYQIGDNRYVFSPLPALSAGVDGAVSCSGTNHWFDDAVNGDVYNNVLRRLWVAELLDKSHGITDRNQLKIALLKHVLYGDPRKTYVQEHPLVYAMRQMYPDLMAFIAWHRDAFDGTRCRALACKMQQMESDLLMRVVARLTPARLPMLTIHDAVLTPHSHVPAVVDALRAESAAMGVPKVGLKVDGQPLDSIATFDPLDFAAQQGHRRRQERSKAYFESLMDRATPAFGVRPT
jgi:hypothetical protein